ncbi:hypothetical protein HHI36_009732 [Cryptolaemus montrouzieri]|uniref:Uncharacterized protein n=1 Tax=Cryptolaemus montrouzieri TaxID=559131 RepID=A0ABD2MH36_9CUCU
MCIENTASSILRISTDNTLKNIPKEPVYMDNEVHNLEERNIEIKRKRKIFPPKESRSKKPKRDPDTWKKRKAVLQTKGEEYISYKNILVPKKNQKWVFYVGNSVVLPGWGHTDDENTDG